MTEIEEGRGYVGPDGLDYIHLDLRHLGAKRINEHLPLIREVCIQFNDLDPIESPIPCRPVAHYSMGGIETNIHGATKIQGIWAAGEAACVSLHGANRLGANSTAECLVWGRIVGEQTGRYCAETKKIAPLPESKISAEYNRVFEGFLHRKGSENLYSIKRELRVCMDRHVGVFRTEQELQQGLEKVRSLRKRFANISIEDKSSVYNTNLYHALELENLLDLAEVMVTGALQRTESRGAHARRDFKTRDDEHWLFHTLAFCTDSGPKLEHKPVVITTWQPVERTY
jgi:succinate dehydrogenase / fumarate reductase, flavoprotein subunit